MTVIRFTIGDAFPARDPVARFITGMAMISNDLLRALEDMLRLEGDAPEQIGRRVSLFRRQAAAVQEAATFIDDARRMFPEVSSFIDGLDGQARAGCEHVIGAVDVKSPHYLGKWESQLAIAFPQRESATRGRRLRAAHDQPGDASCWTGTRG